MPGRDRVAEMLSGVPYAWGGRSLAGADCYGLCRLFALYDRGEEWPEFAEANPTTPADRESVRRVVDGLSDLWEPVQTPMRGDVVLVDGGAGMGVVLDRRRVLTTDPAAGAFVWLLGSAKWQNRITGFYRYRNP